jgi:hypothetical protein
MVARAWRGLLRLVPWAAAGCAVIAGLRGYWRVVGPSFPSASEVGAWLGGAAWVVVSLAALAATGWAYTASRKVRRLSEVVRALAAALPPGAGEVYLAPLGPGPLRKAFRKVWPAVRAGLRGPATAGVRALPWAAVAVTLVLSLSGWLRCASVANAPLDDAYIAFRYARNMAQGYVFVWNRGEAPSGGVTCPLFVAMLTPAFLIGVGPGNLAHALNAAGTLGLVACVLAVVRIRRRAPPLLAALVLAIFLTDTAIVRHAGFGMETMVNAFALALHLALVVALLRRPRVGPAVASAFVAVAAGLLRPESAVLCGLAYVPLIVKLARSRQWRLLALSAGLYVALGLAYVAWSFSHFGYLLPNAFYLKCVDPREFVGWPYVRDFLVSRWYVAAMAGLGAVALAGRRRWGVLAACGLPALFLLGYLPTVLHEMSPWFRYEIPLYTYAVALAALGLHVVQLRGSRARGVLAGTVALAAGLLVLPVAPERAQLGMPMAMFASLGQALGSTGLGHRAVLHEGAAGRMPYESDFWHVDSGAGLVTDALCGRVPLTVEERQRYFSRTPADVRFAFVPPAAEGVESCWDSPAFVSGYVQDLLVGARRELSVLRRHVMERADVEQRTMGVWALMVGLRESYVCVGEYARPWRGHRYFGYVRRDSPYRAQLERVLRPYFLDTSLSRGEYPGGPDEWAAGTAAGSVAAPEATGHRELLERAVGRTHAGGRPLPEGP